jgi:hypothetical protein
METQQLALRIWWNKWRRFCIFMSACIACGALFFLLLPSEDQQYVDHQKEITDCRERCRPKVGVFEKQLRYPGQTIFDRGYNAQPLVCQCK